MTDSREAETNEFIPCLTVRFMAALKSKITSIKRIIRQPIALTVSIIVLSVNNTILSVSLPFFYQSVKSFIDE